jgi:hypothetical protein
MILAALILGTLIVGGTLLAVYFREVQKFMQKVIQKLKVSFKTIVQGSTVFIKKIEDKFQTRTKHYSKNEIGQWKETIVTKTQEEDEVPEKYRTVATMDDEFDITPDFEMELTNNG